MRATLRPLIAALVIAAVPAALEAQAKLPDGVTSEMVEAGQKVFAGKGLCYACHGQKGEGLLHPVYTKLVEHEWIHSDGAYPEIVKFIAAGVTKEKAKSGIMMPAMGGAKLTDDELKAVAAYVFSISRKKA